MIPGDPIRMKLEEYFILDEMISQIERQINPISKQNHTYRVVQSSCIETAERRTTSKIEALDNFNSYLLNHPIQYHFITKTWLI